MMVFNTLGMPVTQVMTGFDSRNLPIGIQVRKLFISFEISY